MSRSSGGVLLGRASPAALAEPRVVLGGGEREVGHGFLESQRLHLSTSILHTFLKIEKEPSFTAARTPEVTSLSNLDRFLAFKRRRESSRSPTGTPSSPSTEDRKKIRSSSPAWLSRMRSHRSSSKHADSPVPVVEGSSSVSQMDGSCFGKPAGAKYEDEPAQEGPPPLPSFLTLNEIEMRDKYAELTRLENERLAQGSTDPQWSRQAPDPALDRYSNIYPWGNNRIKLNVPEGVNDYINASPVSLVSTSNKQSDLKAGVQDKYICMQGPKKQTVNHVWHMVWHELAEPYTTSPAVVIMLTPTHAPMPNDPSRMFEKCYEYYPLDENSPPLRINDSGELGENFKATVRFEERLPGIEGTPIEIRKLIMTLDGDEEEEKPIYHYLYPHWPDFGALATGNVESILNLMQISRKANGRGENARLIHCSAGVGRTGTFVALEFLLGELEGGAWEGWDNSEHAVNDPVYETVNQLRMQRKTMVQAYDQYAFLYEVLRKRWEEKYEVPCVGGEHTHMAPTNNDVCVNGNDEE